MDKVKLPEPFRTNWLEALRSGEYRQTSSKLYDSNDNGYCCLGISCIVIGLEKEDITGLPYPTRHPMYTGLPDSIRQDSDDIHSNTTDKLSPFIKTLVNMNDGINQPLKSFAQIADWLEENTEPE